MKQKSIYIAGPIRGLPRFNFDVAGYARCGHICSTLAEKRARESDE